MIPCSTEEQRIHRGDSNEFVLEEKYKETDPPRIVLKLHLASTYFVWII